MQEDQNLKPHFLLCFVLHKDKTGSKKQVHARLWWDLNDRKEGSGNHAQKYKVFNSETKLPGLCYPKTQSKSQASETAMCLYNRFYRRAVDEFLLRVVS